MTSPAMDKPNVAMRRWHDYDWEAVLAGRKVAQRYFVRSGLVRKDRLCNFVPSGYHPATAVVRNFNELLQGLAQLGDSQPEIASKKSVVKFVLKKAQSSNAHGIRFITDVEAARLLQISSRRRRASWSGLLAAPVALWLFRATGRSWHRFVLISFLALAAAAWRFTSWPRDWTQHELLGEVLQRNVEPWLHGGRKFHLRVLLLCVGDLTAYVHEDVRVLLASASYADGCESGRLDVHVTNMGVNRAVATNYSETKQNIALTELGEELATKLFGELSEVLGKTLRRVREAGRRHFFTLSNCWELFGVDFLVDTTGRPLLLEINPSPSLAMYGDVDLATLLGDDPLNDGFKLPQSWHHLQLVS